MLGCDDPLYLNNPRLRVRVVSEVGYDSPFPSRCDHLDVDVPILLINQFEDCSCHRNIINHSLRYATNQGVRRAAQFYRPEVAEWRAGQLACLLWAALGRAEPRSAHTPC
jgi:hypothetical protein